MADPTARLILDEFHRWAKREKKWDSAYKKLTLKSYECMYVSFEEMDALKPNLFDAWWLQNNSRFKLSGREIRDMRNLMHEFLTDMFRKKKSDKNPWKPATNPS